MEADDRTRSRRNYVLTVGATAGSVVLAGCPIGTDWSSVEPADPTATADGSEGSDAPSEADETDDAIHVGYETTEVTASAPGGEVLGSVTAAVADTPQLRYLGLSDTEHLPEDRGMLFIFERVNDRTFVMREMDFGIDIVYADDAGTITSIHHAPAPEPDEDGSDQRYPGRGQYVLEVSLGWTADRGVEVGHTLDWGS